MLLHLFIDIILPGLTSRVCLCRGGTITLVALYCEEEDLPVDMIKIDQSFVFTMHENKGNALIVESVVTIGQKFNLKVLAEGVENIEALEQLSDIHCDYYQGNYAFKPLPFEAFKKALA